MRPVLSALLILSGCVGPRTLAAAAPHTLAGGTTGFDLSDLTPRRPIVYVAVVSEHVLAQRGPRPPSLAKDWMLPPLSVLVQYGDGTFGVAGNVGELLQIFGEIDTPTEGAMVVFLTHGYGLEWAQDDGAGRLSVGRLNSARSSDGGIDVVTQKIEFGSCDANNDAARYSYRVLLHVAPDGKLSERRRTLVKEGVDRGFCDLPRR